ncbi:MAG: hypothetical protein D6722_18760, partial [Bacteroidetes bacterium]
MSHFFRALLAKYYAHQGYLVALFGVILVFLGSCKAPEQLPKAPQGPLVVSPPDGFRPALLAPAPGDTASRPLPFHRLDISVQVHGNLARTTLEAEIYNPYDQVLSGTFVLPLQEGQTPSRFALEVNGSLREAVVVEKNQGRQVYESIVRRGIDPGLLEWVRGNHFRARIFPIPARGYKRFVIAFEQELRPLDDDLLYLLPLAIPDTLDQLDLRVTVYRDDLAPEPYQHQLEILTFAPWQEAYVAEQHLKRVVADKQLGFRIPGAARGDQVFIEPHEEATYFYLQHRPERFLKEAEAPGLISLLWDNSRSMEGRDLAAELRLLDVYFRALGEVEVELVEFHHEARRRGRFQIRGGDWDRLRSVLEALTPDGGTRLGTLSLGQYPGDEMLLFTDGLSLAEEEALAPARAPLTIVSSAQGTDHSRLRRLAQAGGGRYLPLTQLSVPEALEALRFQPYRFLGASFDSTQVYEAWPQHPQPVGEYLTLAGQMQDAPAELFLHFGYGSTIIRTETVLLNPTTAQGGGGLLPHLWARKKLDDLMLAPAQNHQAILALGRQYGIVTPRTSLIVLDRVEDYVENAIEPPAELKAKYDELMAQRKAEREVKFRTHLDEVAEDYYVRQAWWSTRFEVPETPFQADTTQVEREESGGDSDGVMDVQDVWAAEPATMEVLVAEEAAPTDAPAPAPPRPS